LLFRFYGILLADVPSQSHDGGKRSHPIATWLKCSMNKKSTVHLGRTCYYRKSVFEILLLITLLILTVGRAEVREQIDASQSAAEVGFTPVITFTIAGANTLPEQPTPMAMLIPSPTATKISNETPAARLYDENMPAGVYTYVLPLTVRHVMTDSASLFFELNEPADGYLYYQAISALEGAVQAV
jgi:hypothetical protein